MVKIENLDEFNRIKEAKFGFVVESQNDTSQIHKAECEDLTSSGFIDAESNDNFSYNWFSTLALVEKEFPKAISCIKCNPD